MTPLSLDARNAADFLAAVPALLGFFPDNSVVAVCFGPDRTLGPVIRHDADRFSPAEVVRIVGAMRTNGVAAVVLITVADDEHAEQSWIAVAELVENLIDTEVHVLRVLHTAAITPGARYLDLDTGDTGTVSDPRNGEVTAAAVFEGISVEANRAAIAARFAETEEISEAVGLAAAARLGERVLAATVGELAAAIAADILPGADLVARTGLILAGNDAEVHRSFLRLSVCGSQCAAQVMTYVAAHLRAMARARALTVAGFCLYLGGSGPAASIALDAAAEAAEYAFEPVPDLTVTLAGALRNGLHPTTLRDLVPSAHDVEAATGAYLPG